jgi:hypothetical protein
MGRGIGQERRGMHKERKETKIGFFFLKQKKHFDYIKKKQTKISNSS